MTRPKKIRTNRTTRLRNEVEKYLEKNIEASTGAIFEHINNTTRHGTTMNVLGTFFSPLILTPYLVFVYALMFRCVGLTVVN